MTTIHGRAGMLYLQGSGAVAVKIGTARKWEIKIDRKLDENNSLGDTWQTNLEGIRPWSGVIEGNADTTDRTPFDAATNSSPVKFYFYPVATVTAQFYSGLCWPKLSYTDSLDAVQRYTCDFTGDGAFAMT